MLSDATLIKGMAGFVGNSRNDAVCSQQAAEWLDRQGAISQECRNQAKEAYMRSCLSLFHGDGSPYFDTAERAALNALQTCLGASGCSRAPDGMGFGRFGDCCNRHDLCYTWCGSERLACDKAFYNCGVSSCGPWDLVCKAAARTYYRFVRGAGWLFFESDGPNCVPIPAAICEIR